MPDKYSYKQNKKKKAVKRPGAAPTAGSGETQPAQPLAAAPMAPAARTSVTQTAAVPARTESRVGARVSNLGAELRRVMLMGGVIVVVLVVAALALT